MLDIAAGIPSYNEEDNISLVTRQLDRGLNEYFPGKIAVIVNMDSCSRDKTVEKFMNTTTHSGKKVLMKEGVRGKGNMVRMLLEFINSRNIEYALMVDADLKSITPDWVHLLLNPVFNGHDYCAPLYSRHKYDGTITNLIVYPLVYGLYGWDIRQPIGGDFAFSKRAADCWMGEEWFESTRHYGIDNFMTTAAVCRGLKICQAKLGAKIHKASGPKLGQMFIQVVATLFENAHRCFNFISGVREVSRPEIFGNREATPEEVVLDSEEIKQKADRDFERYRQIYEDILPAGMPGRIRSGIDAADWCVTVYSFLKNYNKIADKEHLIQALSPLYFSRIHSFIEETRDMGQLEAENLIRENAKIFFDRRDIFVENKQRA